MLPALPIVNETDSIQKISQLINKQTPAVIVKQKNGYNIITRHDLIGAIS
jgi:predicted transcriptional regulator